MLSPHVLTAHLPIHAALCKNGMAAMKSLRWLQGVQHATSFSGKQLLPNVC
ncbi:hypothetical protein [Jiella mangrovi]|uniref:Uncharacterized protein n=1 Tax=Jiella mangrovi TaxID=2821407 RepID=A0ABS4BBJ3_9HYPH|nr:hypothetical protein [Jiella mangrovi]MBP0614110.1 hypothetical protein [Jiella mangrovi]